MISIELTPQQVEELKSFYVIELEKIQKRASEINGLIGKLGGNAEMIQEPATTKVEEKTEIKTSVKNTKENTELIETKEKNPKWSSFVLQVLQEKQKPLTRKAITKLYEQQYNVKVSNNSNVMNSLVQALARLRVTDKKIVSFKKAGVKGKLYGLIKEEAKPVIKEATIEKIQEKKIVRPPRKSRAKVKDSKNSDSKNAFSWSDFIRKTLAEQKHVLSTREFTPIAIHYFGLTNQDLEKTRNKLSFTLVRLSRNVKDIRSIKKEGEDRMSFGLAGWFDEIGQLIPEYK